MSTVRYLLIPEIGDVKELTATGANEWMSFEWFRRRIGHHFDEGFEHVAVLYDGERRDMFVGETSAINGRHIRNIRATEIYRCNTLTNDPGIDPESLPAISGPAVLFPFRRVWF